MSSPRHLALTAIVALTAALAACNRTSDLTPRSGANVDALGKSTTTTTTTTPGYDYVTTVNLSASDTQSSILKLVPGTIIVWHQTGTAAPFALVGQTAAQASATTTQKVSAKEVNKKRLRQAESAGATAWSGGATAWSGGVGMWSGGAGMWSGGTTSTQDSLNSGAWTQAKLAGAQSAAPKLGAGVTVAVIDTGLDLQHPLFQGHLAPSADWKDWVDNDANPQEGYVSGATNAGYGHGTGVAGIILQVAPNATILPLRVMDSEGYGDTANVAAAIDYAVIKGAKVINLSLGADTDIQAIDKEISDASTKGVVVFASSGNSGDTNVTYPAANSMVNGPTGNGLVSVGSVSTTSLDVKSSFSTYGKLEMLAPGEAIWTAYPNGQQATATGTSFATPIVAGGAALAFGQNAGISPSTMTAAATGTADPIDAVNPSLSGQLGKGRVDLQDFVKKALGLI